jgi:hypothetical protein
MDRWQEIFKYFVIYKSNSTDFFPIHSILQFRLFLASILYERHAYAFESINAAIICKSFLSFCISK